MIISYSILFFQTLDKKIPSSHEISLGHGLKAVRCFFLIVLNVSSMLSNYMIQRIMEKKPFLRYMIHESHLSFYPSTKMIVVKIVILSYILLTFISVGVVLSPGSIRSSTGHRRTWLYCQVLGFCWNGPKSAIISKH